MVSLKEFARENSISYEAVRKQVNRYNIELDGHIAVIKRTKYLDEYAVEFLRSKRRDNPVIVVQMDKDDEIKRLEAENKALLLKVTELQEALLREKDVVQELQAAQVALLSEKQSDKSIWQKIKSAWKK